MSQLRKLHDKLFKYALSDSKSAQKIFQLMPASVRKDFDLRTIKKEPITHIDEELQEHFADVIMSCRWKKNKTARISFIYEHKSYPDVLLQLQLNRYIINGYESQYREKDKNKAVFDLIIGVLLKHGNEDWEVRRFDTYVYKPDDSYKRYIPSFDMIVLDLSKISDEELQVLGYSFLFSTLFLFKHKGDKEFIKQHYKEIFIFVEEEAYSEQLEKYINVLILYIYAAFRLGKEEVQEMVEKVPPIIKSTMESTYDILIEEGRQLGLGQGLEQGLQKGLAKGLQEGQNKGVQIGGLKVAIEVAIEMLKSLPEWGDIQIGKIAKLESTVVKQLRTVFYQAEKIESKKLVEDLFKTVPDLLKKDIEELDKWLLDLWQNFQKETKENKSKK